MTDPQLIEAYITTTPPESEKAFAALVERHIHLVHAAAVRQTRDPHLADDITQAVFMVLARRAKDLRGRSTVTGWLINTTRYVALSARKIESRRRLHEQKAAAMTPLVDEDSADVAADFSPILDRALAHLTSKDRSAIALRYLQGKRILDVSLEMGISEQAAQKRVNRALEKLRAFFSRHGVSTPAGALESSLANQSLHAAPASLLAAISSNSLATASATSTVTILTNATLKAMTCFQTKVLVSACAAAMLLAGATILVIKSPLIARADNPVAAAAPAAPIVAPAPSAPESPPASQASTFPAGPPILLSNATFFDTNTNSRSSNDFVIGPDPAVKRSSLPALAIHSTSTLPTATGSATRTIDFTPFLGKRLRYSAWVKSDDLTGWAGLTLFARGEDALAVAVDDMGDRPITGTTDWKECSIVCDIANDTDLVRLGLFQRGSGHVYLDGAKLELVDETTPITDNQTWHSWSQTPTRYTKTIDETTTRNGHPTILLSSNSSTRTTDWIAYDHDERSLDQYRGKRMKMTGWIKTESVSTPSGFSIRVLGPGYKDLQPDAATRKIRGTTPWTKYEVIAKIPDKAQSVDSGVRLYGKGKLWLDEIRYEVLEP